MTDATQSGSDSVEYTSTGKAGQAALNLCGMVLHVRNISSDANAQADAAGRSCPLLMWCSFAASWAADSGYQSHLRW